ncbi:MAG TPA: AbrB/MazE/SpoVT family DNA-binding domain-containing protein [Chiayiivirga sp.]|nr:AbrB/MazE/SpoVT family DNA-binding domain-containing protein [Chiayiivirga sp.]
MLAKLTSKNQLTLPKAATAAVEAAEYFDVQTRDGVIILTPVRIQRADAVRAKLAELALDEDDIRDAVQWARQRVAEPDADYHAKPAAKALKPAKRKP